MVRSVALLALLPLAAAYLVPGPWSDVSATPDERAAALVANMTLDEKLAMLHGPPTGKCCQCTTSPLCAYVGNVVPNKRLGIPPINMNGIVAAPAPALCIDIDHRWASGATVQGAPSLTFVGIPRQQ